MIHIKNAQEIESMKKGGHMLAVALNEALSSVKPGITEGELDKIAENSIRKQGGKPGFMEVPGYKHTICTATNEVIVHVSLVTMRLNEGMSFVLIVVSISITSIPIWQTPLSSVATLQPLLK